MSPDINPLDITCIIPTSDTPDMLCICLSTLKYYMPEIKNILVVGHDTNDKTADVANKYLARYINLNANPDRELHFEHLDGVTYGIEHSNSDWVLILHSDMEFVAPFWNYILKSNKFDMLYAEPVKNTGTKFYSAPKSSFILARTELFEESKNCGISLDSRADGDVVYDVFYDWWKWLEDRGKTISLVTDQDFYIHYWGYTHYRKNPNYINNANMQSYLKILDSIVKHKISHINNIGLPFPEDIQSILLKTLEKNASR